MVNESCPLCGESFALKMSSTTSALVCSANETHYLTLVEWSDWVQDRCSTAAIMRLLVRRSHYESCVLCGLPTPYTELTPIDWRYGYVEGVGQLCSMCYEDVDGPNQTGT